MASGASLALIGNDMNVVELAHTFLQKVVLLYKSCSVVDKTLLTIITVMILARIFMIGIKIIIERTNKIYLNEKTYKRWTRYAQRYGIVSENKDMVVWFKKDDESNTYLCIMYDTRTQVMRIQNIVIDKNGNGFKKKGFNTKVGVIPEDKN